MTTTTAAPVRFDIGHVFSRTFGVLSANLLPFLLLAMFFSAAPAFLVSLVQTQFSTNLPLGEEQALNFASVAIQLGLGYMLSAALVRGTIVDLDGRKASIGDSLAVGLKYAIPAFIIAMIVGFGVVLGLILLVIPGIFLALAWSVSTQVLVIERKGIFGSISRSAALTRGHRWSILGLMVCFILLAIAISIPFGIAGTATSFALGGAAWPKLVATAIASAVGTTLNAIMLTAAYAELRGAREGVGVNELAAVFD